MHELKHMRQPETKRTAMLVKQVLLTRFKFRAGTVRSARVFGEAVDVTGIILTKLDGTAKGGVVLGIADELKLPIHYIGIGEKVEDLRPFDPEEFVDALFPALEETE